jgi:ATP-dependent helicase HrpA
LSFNRMREWLDVHRELLELVKEAGIGRVRETHQGEASRQENAGRDATVRFTHPTPVHRVHRGGTDHDQYAAVHRAILAGLLSSLALRGDGYEYTVAGGGKAHLWPGSGVFQEKPKWTVAAEVVETTKRYLRTCARIDPRWIEPIAGHLIKRTYREAYWDPAHASAMALERVTLFGLTIVGGRRVHYGPIDPEASRHMLIEHGLVEGHIEPKPGFLVRNQEMIAEVQRLEAKIRRRDLVVGDWARYQFYDRRIPAEVFDGASLERWTRQDGANERSLLMTEADLLREAVEVHREDFPDRVAVRRMELPLDYRYDPGSAHDGVTVTVPLEGLNQLDPEPLEWLVPGRLLEKVLALIRSLPKTLRTRFVPAPESAQKVLPLVRFGEGNFHEAVAAALSRIGGIEVPPDAFQDDRLPDDLRMNLRVTDATGRTLSWGRDLDALRHRLGSKAAASFNSATDPRWTRDGLTTWDFDELPAEIDVDRGGVTMKAHPALFDRRTSVSLRLVDSPERAAHETHFGLRRLFLLAAEDELQTQVQWMPGLDVIQSQAGLVKGFELERQVTELLAEQAFLAGESTPRTKAEFQRQLAAGRERIGGAVQEVLELLRPLFEGYSETIAALEQFHRASTPLAQIRVAGVPAVEMGNKEPGKRDAYPTAGKWQYALDDIEEQLGHLMQPGFLASTPWEWLRQYPRYFRAIRIRLEALSSSLPRDRQKLDEFQPRWQLYLEQSREQANQGIFDPALLHYRWMLEEYRVSLFAQKLGTAVPVSFKRLEQQWAKVRG